MRTAFDLFTPNDYLPDGDWISPDLPDLGEGTEPYHEWLQQRGFDLHIGVEDGSPHRRDPGLRELIAVFAAEDGRRIHWYIVPGGGWSPAMLARWLHRKQGRNGAASATPYTTHLGEVAALVASVGADEATQHAAWLHDAMEDQGVRFQTLVERYGVEVARLVLAVTDQESGNRAERLAGSVARLHAAPENAKVVKLADIVSNLTWIDKSFGDPEFLQIYKAEKRAQFDVLKVGRQYADLYHMAGELCYGFADAPRIG